MTLRARLGDLFDRALFNFLWALITIVDRVGHR